jgi:hypothetical protein
MIRKLSLIFIISAFAGLLLSILNSPAEVTYLVGIAIAVVGSRFIQI